MTPRLARLCSVLLSIATLLSACSSGKGRVRVDVKLDNIDQADILVYSPDGAFADIDTLHLRKGKTQKDFSVVGGPYTFTLIYPNMTTFSFVAREGKTVKLRGDVLQLDSIRAHGADSIIGRRKMPASRLVPVGKAVPKDSVIQANREPGKALLIAFWANWRGGSGAATYALRNAMTEYGDHLTALSYSLDTETVLYNIARANDNVSWAAYCDYMGWDSPSVVSLGLNNIPYFVLIDEKGKLLAHGKEYMRDISPVLRKEFPPKETDI